MEVTLPEHVSGDTFNGVQFTIEITEDEVTGPENLTGASIVMHVKKTETSPVVLELSLGNGLTMVDAPNGIFQIDEQVITLEPGLYLLYIRFTIGPRIKTWIEGTWTIRLRGKK